jgi:DNA-binding MltR family transcriptional regulator
LPDRRPTQSAWIADLKRIVEELDSESDRAVAIVGVALLDEKLRQALEALFDPGLSTRDRADLFEGPVAPLGTYAAKTRTARALGFFQDDFQDDLQLLGRIRNRFAHDLSVRSFEDPKISGLCERLRGYKTQRMARDGTGTPLVQWKSAKDARSAFIATVQVAVYLLMIFLDYKGLFRVNA